jgi:hypothetical protein
LLVTFSRCTRWLFRQHEASEFTPPLETLTEEQRKAEEEKVKEQEKLKKQAHKAEEEKE